MATQADIAFHYDVSNDFYAAFLDREYRAYSCGVWKSATTLEKAQEAKLDRLCRYANVRPGDHIIDVGCGWGGLMKRALSCFGASSAQGLTLSSDQFDYVDSSAFKGVHVALCSWEDFDKKDVLYDSVISIGAFEHFASMEDRRLHRHRDVYRKFFKWCKSVSKDDASIGLQTIITARAPATLAEIRDTRYLLEKVFPGSSLPCISDIQAAALDIYEISAAKRIGLDYARTLEEWNGRMQNNRKVLIASHGEDVFEHYQRYFQCAIRGFQSGVVDLYQLSLTPIKEGRIRQKNA